MSLPSLSNVIAKATFEVELLVDNLIQIAPFGEGLTLFQVRDGEDALTGEYGTVFWRPDRCDGTSLDDWSFTLELDGSIATFPNGATLSGAKGTPGELQDGTFIARSRLAIAALKSA